jgi:hypothetical protein
LCWRSWKTVTFGHGGKAGAVKPGLNKTSIPHPRAAPEDEAARTVDALGGLRRGSVAVRG